MTYLDSQVALDLQSNFDWCTGMDERRAIPFFVNPL